MPGKSPIDFFLPVHQGHEHGRVSRIAALNDTVEDKARFSTCEEDLVPVGSLPVPLLDNVGMTLEKGDDLLACGDLFPVDYPAPSPVHDSGQQTQRSLRFLDKNTRLDHLLGIKRSISGESRNGTFSVAPHQSSEIEQIFVARPAYRFFPAVFDLKYSFFDHPPVIAEMVAWMGKSLLPSIRRRVIIRMPS